ncbi:MAG: phenylalanine--tRNA ligase subunit beta [Simkaniaceae bacterium]|nr:phenylalanine--tRNA ligase subunit beta [Simkaniaceae bacterium]
MLVPLSWLREYVPVDMPPEEIATGLTLYGVEVDRILRSPSPFTGVVVGRVIGVSAHPAADRLKLLEVSDGREIFPVVCGDLTVTEGLHVAFAKPGAVLTDEGGKARKVGKAKLRGVESCGMLCSEKELRISDEHDTIIRLPGAPVSGTDLADLLGDPLFEISLTPDLGHCMSIFGVARTLAMVTQTKATYPFSEPEESEGDPIRAVMKVSVADREGCSRYACRLIRGTAPVASPPRLRERLESVGLRSVNCVVDAVNYVMLALGQPMHAFDYDRIEGGQLIVDTARETFPFLCLDGETRTVPEGTVMIFDGKKHPLAIAGVMGGAASSVTASTSSVLLESACFSPKRVRRASRALSLSTDSSRRFERGVDPGMTLKALDEVAHLIQTCPGGRTATGMIDVGGGDPSARKITLRLPRVNALLGTVLKKSTLKTLLLRMEMGVRPLADDLAEISVPSYRNDVREEVDLIAEIAKVYGYNDIPARKAKISYSTLSHSPLYLMEEKVRERCIAEGLQEFLLCDLISPRMAEMTSDCKSDPGEAIRVLKAASVEQSVLRTSLLPGLLQVVKHNFDRNIRDLSGFEIGRIRFKKGGRFHERAGVAILLTGRRIVRRFKGEEREVDFFDLKGVMENLATGLKIPVPVFSSSDFALFHPGRQATVKSGSLRIGVAGEVHPGRLRMFAVKRRVYFGYIDLQDLLSLQGGVARMTPLPKFPESERDWTVMLPREVAIGCLMQGIRKRQPKLLKEIALIDLYEGEEGESEIRHATLRLTYRDENKTIEHAEVEKVHLKLTEEVLSDLGLRVS